MVRMVVWVRCHRYELETGERAVVLAVGDDECERRAWEELAKPDVLRVECYPMHDEELFTA